RLVPVAVIDRLGPSLYSTAGAAGQALAWARLPELAARTLPQRRPPAWIYLHGLKSPLSSTALRAALALPRHKCHSLEGSGLKRLRPPDYLHRVGDSPGSCDCAMRMPI